jgi:hypothetical protein
LPAPQRHNEVAPESRQNLDACETGREISFCGHAILDIDPALARLHTMTPDISWSVGSAAFDHDLHDSIKSLMADADAHPTRFNTLSVEAGESRGGSLPIGG